MSDLWKALADGETVPVADRTGLLRVIDCGKLHMPSGKLVCCDPFAMMNHGKNPFVQLPPGDYPVKVTIADLSEKRDGSSVREAYASLLLLNRPEVKRALLSPLLPDEDPPELEPEEFVGFSVDAGTACFVDNDALITGMPEESTWGDDLFENASDKCWFHQMDDPAHIREGIANIPLPLAKDGSNLILFHSGWGDGFYPVWGGYDKNGKLVAVHIDFFVVGE